MLGIIKSLLLQIINDIDTGNSNICEEDEAEIIECLKKFTDKDRYISKYAACQYLRVSRATFDNYVREGKIPRGEHRIGFKELGWKIKDLDSFLEMYKKKDDAK